MPQIKDHLSHLLLAGILLSTSGCFSSNSSENKNLDGDPITLQENEGVSDGSDIGDLEAEILSPELIFAQLIDSHSARAAIMGIPGAANFGAGAEQACGQKISSTGTLVGTKVCGEVQANGAFEFVLEDGILEGDQVRIWATGDQLSGDGQIVEQVMAWRRTTPLVVNGVLETKQGTWSLDNDGLYFLKDGDLANDFQIFTRADKLPSNQMLSMVAMDEDNFLVGTTGGLAHVSWTQGQIKFEKVLGNELPFHHIHRIFPSQLESGDENLGEAKAFWIAGGLGLFKLIWQEGLFSVQSMTYPRAVVVPAQETECYSTPGDDMICGEGIFFDGKVREPETVMYPPGKLDFFHEVPEGTVMAGANGFFFAPLHENRLVLLGAQTSINRSRVKDVDHIDGHRFLVADGSHLFTTDFGSSFEDTQDDFRQTIGVFSIHAILRDRVKQNVFWIGMANGLGKVTVGNSQAIFTEELSYDLVSSVNHLSYWDDLLVLGLDTRGSVGLYDLGNQELSTYKVLTDRPISTLGTHRDPSKFWVGTWDGLRFLKETESGLEVEAIEPSTLNLPSNEVSKLLQTQDGTLFVGGQGGVTRVDINDPSRTLSTRDQLDEHNVVYHLLPAGENDVWAGFSRNILWFGGDGTIKTTSVPATNSALDMDVDPRGVLWVGLTGGGVTGSQLDRSTLQRVERTSAGLVSRFFSISNSNFPGMLIWDLVVTGPGEFIASFSGIEGDRSAIAKVKERADGSLSVQDVLMAHDGTPLSDLNGLTQDQYGVVWGYRNNHLYRIDAQSDQPTATNINLSDHTGMTISHTIRRIICDSFGQVWVGASAFAWNNLNQEWIEAKSALVRLSATDNFETLQVFEVELPGRIALMASDGARGVWLSTLDLSYTSTSAQLGQGNGLFHFSPQGQFTHEARNLPDPDVSALYHGKMGEFFVATHNSGVTLINATE